MGNPSAVSVDEVLEAGSITLGTLDGQVHWFVEFGVLVRLVLNPAGENASRSIVCRGDLVIAHLWRRGVALDIFSGDARDHGDSRIGQFFAR